MNEDENINGAMENFSRSITWSADSCIPKSKSQRNISTPMME